MTPLNSIVKLYSCILFCINCQLLYAQSNNQYNGIGLTTTQKTEQKNERTTDVFYNISSQEQEEPTDSVFVLFCRTWEVNEVCLQILMPRNQIENLEETELINLIQDKIDSMLEKNEPIDSLVLSSCILYYIENKRLGKTDADGLPNGKSWGVAILDDVSRLGKHCSRLGRANELVELVKLPNPLPSNICPIDYTIYQETPLSILVYDINGNVVANLSEQTTQRKGQYTLWWDTSTLSSGNYFILFQTPHGNITEHVVKVY